MSKKMLLLLILIAPQMVFANVLISEVLYDPETSESDTEYVELFNQGDVEVNISGWFLNTTSLQATIPAGSVIKANSYFLIADEDDGGNWPSNWAEPDYSGEEISLTNSDSGVQLVDSSGTVVDVVGWGSAPTGLYEGVPYGGASSGESLTRIKQNNSFVDTDNNLNDFFATTPNPSNSNQGSEDGVEIGLYATVSGNPPIIDSVNISPDDSLDEGVQIMPVPGGEKGVLFSVVVTDFDGYDDVNSVEAQLQFGTADLSFDTQLNDTSALYKGYFNMSFYYDPGNHSVIIFADDHSAQSSTANSSFEYLGVAAFDVDTDIILFEAGAGSFSEVLGDLDMVTLSNPTIKNIGNLKLDFEVFGTDLSSDFDIIGVDNIEYTFLDNDYNSSFAGVLSTEPLLKELNFMPGENQLRELTTRLFIPFGTSTGSYSGSLSLVGLGS